MKPKMTTLQRRQRLAAMERTVREMEPHVETSSYYREQIARMGAIANRAAPSSPRRAVLTNFASGFARPVAARKPSGLDAFYRATTVEALIGALEQQIREGA